MTEIIVKNNAEFDKAILNLKAGDEITIDYDIEVEDEADLMAKFDKERLTVEAWLDNMETTKNEK